MRTFLIKRPVGAMRAIPVTTLPGTGALPPSLVERYRAAGLLLPISAPETRKLSAPTMRQVWECLGHGLLSGPRCPSGCSRRFLRCVEVPLTAEELQAARRARPAAVIRAADGTPIPVGLPVRDRRGRFLRELGRQGEAEPVHANERMTEAEVRVGLNRLLSHLPRGSKKPLARLCGYTGKWALHSLRGVAKGRAKLPDRCRRRISAALNRIQRGDLVLIALPGVRGNGVATHEWRVRTAASERQAIKLQL